MLEHAGVRVQRTDRGLAGDPRRGVRRVAHRRIRGALCRAELGGEHVAAVDARLQHEGEWRREDATQCPQHPVLVVLGRRRRPGRAEDLAAVDVDVDREQRDLLDVEGLLDHPDELVERRCDGLHAGVEQFTQATEADERDRRDAMAGLGTRPRGLGPVGRARARARRRTREEQESAAGPERPGTRRQRSTPSPSSRRSTASGGSKAAVAPVTRISPGRATFSAPIVPSTTGPATTSSRVVPPTRNSSIGPLWRPTDIDSRSRPTDVGMVAGATQLVAHRSGRACGPMGVIVTVEEEQEGIAAELQQLAPLLGATVEHARRTRG